VVARIGEQRQALISRSRCARPDSRRLPGSAQCSRGPSAAEAPPCSVRHSPSSAALEKTACTSAGASVACAIPRPITATTSNARTVFPWRTLSHAELGPGRFEPTTKGFTWPRRFRRDGLFSHLVHEPCVWVRDAPSLLSRALEPSGSSLHLRRCTALGSGLPWDHIPKVSLNSSVHFARFRAKAPCR